jgi:hypothetical protein
MSVLALQRCLHHADREAIARCPECTRYFCRECITEHDDRVICANCLAKLARPKEEPKSRRKLRLSLIGLPMAAFGGLIIAWWCFYFIGRLLFSIPSDFHANKLWDISHLEDERASASGR